MVPSYTNGVESGRKRVLFGVTGSVAGVKGPEIAHRICTELNADVIVLLTRAGENFWTKAQDYDFESWDSFQKVLDNPSEDGSRGSGKVYSADEEWKGWNKMGDPVMHIDLRKWADLLLVAPLSAHCLAKFATGFCDDPLSCCVRAWDFKKCPLLLAPAMNTLMWEHPVTRPQLDAVKAFGDLVIVIPPKGDSMLACGEVGAGALASVDDIIHAVREALPPEAER